MDSPKIREAPTLPSAAGRGVVTRPPYGHTDTPTGVSKLPSGTPGGKGLPLDDSIPGSATFAKPENDIRHDEPDDASMYRVDDPGDVAKDQAVPDSQDHSQCKPSIGAPGQDTTPKTRYPYRDGLPHAHNAACTVLGLWLLRSATEVQLDLASIRVAATLADVMSGLSPKVLARSKKCHVTLKRADLKNLRWIFSVNAGNGPKMVRLKAKRPKANVVALDKMDVWLTCTCPAWQWQGPEYHAKGQYQDGPLQGTASSPDIRDPERANKVCKHVAAVVALVRKWRLGQKRASVSDSWTVLYK